MEENRLRENEENILTEERIKLFESLPGKFLWRIRAKQNRTES